MKKTTQAIRAPHIFLLSITLCALITACGGGGGGGPASGSATDTLPQATNLEPSAPSGTTTTTTTPTTTTTATTTTPNVTPTVTPGVTTTANMTDAQAKDMAMRLWRNDNLQQHPKGSCAGCHGADFFDLARIGSTDTDLTRRATLDGASAEQAQALVQAIRKMRTDFAMPATNARQFRPFQPGGAVLLPNLTDTELVANVKRDLAFAQQLQSLLPTLFGERISTLAQAKQAQKELLDLAAGSNAGGANAQKMNLRNLPTGIAYPLWSADLHQGAAEGTFNDWIGDIAHDAKPEFKVQWLALQDTYLANPSTDNFWRMYAAARNMTQLPLLGNCTLGNNAVVNTGLKCEATDDFNKHKFLTALKGQHMLRMQAAGKLDDFLKGSIAFSYLDNSTLTSPVSALLPADMWEIGDRGRVMLESTGALGSFKGNLESLGYPLFAQNSIDPARSAGTEQTALRKAWFWIGFTMDPSFARIHKSNATQSGEYMIGTLVEERMFNHMHFSALMRLVTKGSLQEANMKRSASNSAALPDRVRFLANYSYATGYGRVKIGWNEDKNIKFDATLKAQSEALFAKLAGNGFRMSMLLQTDALDTSKLNPADLAVLIDIMSNKINTTNLGTIYGLAYNMHEHFEAYHSATQAADEAMIRALLAKLNITANQGF